MPSGKKIFIDTNVLVYANVASSPFQQDAQQALIALPAAYDSLWINRQVIREYLKVMSSEMLKAGKVDYAATSTRSGRVSEVHARSRDKRRDDFTPADPDRRNLHSRKTGV